jgi:hypothetical protein
MKSTIVKLLLVCGILSGLFYAGMDVIDGLQWQHYSWISEEFSRLSAVGAPSRPLHLVLNPFFTAIVIAFGLGVWWSAGGKRTLRVIGAALIVWALVSFTWPQFFPEDLTAPVSAFTNTMHIVIAGVTVVSWMLVLALGATAFGRRFRLYSIVEIVILTNLQAAAMIAGQPAPYIGLFERTGIYSFYPWMSVLAVVLLRRERGQTQPWAEAPSAPRVAVPSGSGTSP